MPKAKTTDKAVTRRTTGVDMFLYRAIAAVQNDLTVITKDATNPYFNSTYATLRQVRAALRPLWEKHGLVVFQKPIALDGQAALMTIVALPESGQTESAVSLLRAEKVGPQADGSSISYHGRYALNCIFQIDFQDDDGEAGEGREDSAEVSTPPAPTSNVGSNQPSAEPPSEEKIKACYAWIEDKDRTMDELEVAERSIMKLADECDPMDKGRIPAMFKIRLSRMKDLQKRREAGEVTVETVSEDLGLE